MNAVLEREHPMPTPSEMQQEISSLTSRVAVLEESARATNSGLADISKKLDVVLNEVSNWKVMSRNQQAAEEDLKQIASHLETFMREDYKPFKEDTQSKINIGKGLWIAGSTLWVLILSMALWYLNLKVGVVEQVPTQIEVLKTQVQSLSTEVTELKKGR